MMNNGSERQGVNIYNILTVSLVGIRIVETILEIFSIT